VTADSESGRALGIERISIPVAPPTAKEAAEAEATEPCTPLESP